MAWHESHAYYMCRLAIGNVTSIDRKSPSVAETEIGVGGTCAWALGGLDPSSTVALYFEVSVMWMMHVVLHMCISAVCSSPACAHVFHVHSPRQIVNQNPQQLKDGRQAYLQIVTRYKHSSGRTHMRVSTIAKTYAELKGEGDDSINQSGQGNAPGLAYIRAGFDQEAAAVLMTRLAVHKVSEAMNVDASMVCDDVLLGS